MSSDVRSRQAEDRRVEPYRRRPPSRTSMSAGGSSSAGDLGGGVAPAGIPAGGEAGLGRTRVRGAIVAAGRNEGGPPRPDGGGRRRRRPGDLARRRAAGTGGPDEPAPDLAAQLRRRAVPALGHADQSDVLLLQRVGERGEGRRLGPELLGPGGEEAARELHRAG